jgi:hypothetical protein
VCCSVLQSCLTVRLHDGCPRIRDVPFNHNTGGRARDQHLKMALIKNPSIDVALLVLGRSTALASDSQMMFAA